jgi:hypothetical protein
MLWVSLKLLSFREIGRRGFQALVNKWFGGSKDEAVNWLHRQQSERQVDRLLSARPVDGISCVEMPVLLSPDDDVIFNEPEVTWQERVAPKRATRVKSSRDNIAF